MTDLLGKITQLETHFDVREPQVLAFLPEEGRFDRLRREAAALLEKYPNPKNHPPLFGTLLGVKDIFHIDGFPTRAGSQLPPEVLRGEEAESVTLSKEAGALILGKTVTTEFAYFAPGPTRNPHKPASGAAHTPGGSSSGSAAAVAAGLCELALGTQTIGSVTRPAAFCGVFGYKPSFDRISKAGVIPLSTSLDHVGLFAPDLAGLGRGARTLCQNWRDLLAPTRRPVLGIPEGPYLDHVEEEGLSHFRATCQKLTRAGFTLVPIPAMPDFDEIVERHNLITAAEAAQAHAKWFSQYSERYHPKTAGLIHRGQQITNYQLRITRKSLASLRNRLTTLMAKHNLDLWLSPSAPGPAPKGLGSTGNPVMNLPWTHAGLPTLGLPSGTSENGLPLGLQLAARFGADEQLFPWGAMIALVL
ncbi:MAG: amidase [Anaerolineales bacterium]